METKQSNNSATSMADAVKIANQRALFSLEWENDTVFKKRELNYKTKAAFQKDLEAGKISKYTTVFIKDSKEIYKNGQYYGAGSSSVVDITNEYSSLISGYSSEIYNKLLGYANSGVITYINDTDRGEAHFVSLSNMYEKLVMSSIATDYNGAPILECYVVDSSIGVVYDETMYFASKDMIGSAILGTYNKAQSYKPVSSGDNVSNAIGKLEANVSKIITNGNGTKFLSDNGEYKELTPLNSGMPYFDLSSFSEESGSVSDEILNSIKNIGLSDSESISIGFYNKAITYIGELRFSAGDYSISGVSVSEKATDYLINSINMSISSNLKVYSLSRFNQEIKKSGLGDKFLSDDGTYKEVKSDSSNQNLINDDLNKLFAYISKKESFTQSDISPINELIKNLSYKNGYFNGKVSAVSELTNLDASFSVQYTDAKNFIVEINSLGSLIGGYQQMSINNIRIIVNNNTIEYTNSNVGFTIEKGKIAIIAKGDTANDTSLVLDCGGDGTKFLSDDGTYKKIESISDAPDENLYVRKKNEWARINIPEVQSDIVFIDIDFMSYSYPYDGDSIDLTLEQYNKISEAIDKKKIFRINAICGTFFGYANLKPVGEQQEGNPIKYQILISSLDSNSIPGGTDINKYENLFLSITEYNGEYKAVFTLCKDKVIITDGNGSLFLSNDGTYKTIINSKLSGYLKVAYDKITENDTIKDAIGKLEYEVTNYATISSNILYLKESSTKEDILEVLKPSFYSLKDFWYEIKSNKKIRIDPEASSIYSDLLLSAYEVIGSGGYNMITITGAFIDSATFDTSLATLKIKFKDEELLKLEFSKFG